MDVEVRFRFDKTTGEVTEFVVEQEQELSEPEHGERHQALAQRIGGWIEKLPKVEEVKPLGEAPPKKKPWPKEPEKPTEHGPSIERPKVESHG